MTRLKIEVTADDDAAALHILKLLRLQMIDSDTLGRVLIDHARGLVSYTFGTATATVEREQGGSGK